MTNWIKGSYRHLLFSMIFFGCFGITVEVFFTAIHSQFTQNYIQNKSPMAMAGMSYVWMAFIYALIPLLGKLVYDHIRNLKIVYRLAIMVSIIYVVEFISGFLLQQLTGSCPWEYKTGWHVMGFIQLEYAPAWLLFAFLTEQLYLFVDRYVIR